MRKALLTGIIFLSLTVQGKADALLSYKVVENSQAIKENARAIDEMSRVIYRMAMKIKQLEKENRELEEKIERIKRELGQARKHAPERKGEVSVRPGINKVLRLVSVFRGTNTAPVIQGLRLIEEKTGAPLFAGIGERYFVVYTTKPIPKEVLREAGFSDAYWESNRKPIYRYYRKISPDDVDSIANSLGSLSR